jgi:hypothetical protein
MLWVPCIGVELSLRFARHDRGYDLDCQLAASELRDDLRRVDHIAVASRIGQTVIKIRENRARSPASIRRVPAPIEMPALRGLGVDHALAGTSRRTLVGRCVAHSGSVLKFCCCVASRAVQCCSPDRHNTTSGWPCAKCAMFRNRAWLVRTRDGRT